MTEPLLQVDGLRVHCFTAAGVVKAVDDVSFSLARGEVLGLVGESGSGKSMTGLAIMGLIDPPGRLAGGRIVFEGLDLAALSTERLRQLRGNRIAMLFQNPLRSLNPVLRIDTQMVEAILAHEAIPGPAALSRARDALVQVGVPAPEASLEAYPHQCSEGMRQRVAVAIALLNRPDLIIADEPTRTLDVTLQGQILEVTQRLVRASGAALLWITRELSLLAGLADRIGVMYAGRVVEEGLTSDVLGAPGHPYTRGLLDSVPGQPPWREKLKQMPGASPSRINLPPGCSFRPRCPYATAECGETPAMRPHAAAGQSLRCFHPLPPPA
jgi:peptide/nickel transport system ATP-binding protein